jgi:uncharacterized membrane protein YgcG
MRRPGEADRAERFARLLDDPASTPADPETASLVAVADRLRSVEPVTVDPDFRASLRAKLHTLAAAPDARDDTIKIELVDPEPPERRLRLVPPAAPRPAWHRPRVGLAAASVVLILFSGLAVMGSRNALPGDPLYALKRSTETAELQLARGDESRGRRYLELARIRATEIEHLTERANPDPATIADTLGTMDQQTKAGVRLLTTSAVRRADNQPLLDIASWFGTQGNLLASSLPRLPAPARDRFAASVTLLGQVAVRVNDLSRQLGCACLAGAALDDLGPVPCHQCAAQPTAATPSAPASSAAPAPTRTPAPGRTTAPGTPQRTGTPGSGGRPGAPAPSGGGGTQPSPSGGGGGFPLPLPLPSGGGNVPLPSIPGLPLPTQLPIPIPLPTSGLPLPTDVLPSLLPTLVPGLGG